MGSGVITWSQTAASNASADSTINWAEGMAPSAVNDSARAMMASVAKWRDDTHGITTTGGTGTAYTLSSNQIITSNVDGFTIQFTPGTTNTGATTLSVDSQTAKPLRFFTGVDLPSGALVSGSVYQATYRSASEEWLLNTPIAAAFLAPTGAVIPYAGSSAPTGWLLANGALISRTVYAGLFAAIGTTYGAGDGSTTFALPDATGRVIAGKESSASRLTSAVSGINGGVLGAAGGVQGVTLDITQIPAHSHPNALSDPGHGHGVSGGSNGGSSSVSVNAGGDTTVPSNVAGISIVNAGAGISIINANAGGNGAHNNVQPTIILNYIIKT